MRKIIFLLFVLCVADSTFSQNNFKEVKTAQDVIDNYITAIGGSEKLKKIKSETVNGKLKVHGVEGNFLFYTNDTIAFKMIDGKVQGKEMLILKSVTTKNYAWEYQTGATRDFEGEDLAKKSEELNSSSPGFYLNYNEKEYSSELKGTDTLNGKECYVIIFSKSGNELRTNYYSKETFYLIQTKRPNLIATEYYDFKEVDGIVKPFRFIQKSETEIDFEISEYNFNKPINNEILFKPDNK
ncbi:MAG: hypothetical protein ABI840_09780 [bacterium]